MSNLQQRPEVHRSRWSAQIVVLDVGNHRYNLPVSRALHPGNAEVNAKRILALREELLHKRLVHYHDWRRGRCVVSGDIASAQHTMTYDVEVLRPDTQPRCTNRIASVRL